MAAVRRLVMPALLALLLVGIPACGGQERTLPPTGSPAPVQTTAPPTPTSPPPSSPSPSAEPRPIPPAWAVPIEEDLEPADLPDPALVPPGAELTDRIELPAGGGLPDQVAVAYAIGEDPFAREQGFAVWQRFPDPPAWSVVFAFVDPPAREVLVIGLQVGDLTRDGHDDVLVFEQTGGTGVCGRWRVIAAVSEGAEVVFTRRTCDTEFLVQGDALDLREAVYEPEDPHCCPSAFRYATYEWNGRRFEETSSRVEPVDGG